jgi:putative hemolysin
MMEILLIALLTLLNGLFSLSEIALVSVKPGRMQLRLEQGDRRAQTVLKLLAEPEGFLSSVQVGITLIGIVSGAFGGATLTDDVQRLLTGAGVDAKVSHSVALLTVIGSITYFTIVVGELVPKTLALSNPEGIALIAAPLVSTFTRFTYPIVLLLSFSTQALLKLLRVREVKEDRLSAEELRSIIKTANLQGLLDHEESQAHHNLLCFSEAVARTLMTPRSQVEWLDVDSQVGEVLQQVRRNCRSNYPLARGSLDQLVGNVRLRDVLDHAEEPEFELAQVVQEPLVITEFTPAFAIVQLFKRSKQYVAFVVDEHGQFEGLVTLHDLTEAIMGSLPEDEESDCTEITPQQDGSWLVGGRTTVRELNRKLQAPLIAEDNTRYTTVAGFFLSRLQCIPEPGQQLKEEHFVGEVVELEGHRIHRVILKLKETSGS